MLDAWIEGTQPKEAVSPSLLVVSKDPAGRTILRYHYHAVTHDGSYGLIFDANLYGPSTATHAECTPAP